CPLRGCGDAADLLDLVADDEDGRARGHLVRLAVEHLRILEQGRARLFRSVLRCGRRDGPGLLGPVCLLLRRWATGSGLCGGEAGGRGWGGRRPRSPPTASTNAIRVRALSIVRPPSRVSPSTLLLPNCC